MRSLLAQLRLMRLRFHWDQFAKRDALWAVLTAPDKKGGGWSLEEFFRRGELEIAALEALLRSHGIELRGRSALDFGCGVGRVTGPLADRFEVALGLDISPRMLELARGYNTRGERCRFAPSSADLRGLEASGFDFVYSKLVLQHMSPREVRAYLPELLRVLRPGGLLVFQLPEPIDDRGRGWKGFIPLPLLRGLRRLRRLLSGNVQFPRMDLHGMPQGEVLRLCASAELVLVAPDQSHGDLSRGFLYVLRKPG